ncbi:MAG: DUF4159 domain-containing protein [Deltaproteobacteria bacterium]|nr:DUF4159 domain-containing protein [Deltaproteobacteria bacterium]
MTNAKKKSTLPFIANTQGCSRRDFLKTAGMLTLLSFSKKLYAIGDSSKIDFAQIIYQGGNWQPRPTALRRLAWETQKRTSVDTLLEPSTIKPSVSKLATHPLTYLSGDRSFLPFDIETIGGFKKYLLTGGTLIIDPSFTPDADTEGFQKSVQNFMSQLFPDKTPQKIMPDHVIFNTFYKLNRAEGMVKSTPWLTGYFIDNRAAVIITSHDLSGAYEMDNLGNWINDVTPGGTRQRENAFRLGINLIMYALCGDYKSEESHKHLLPS